MKTYLGSADSKHFRKRELAEYNLQRMFSCSLLCDWFQSMQLGHLLVSLLESEGHHKTDRGFEDVSGAALQKEEIESEFSVE